MDLQAGRSLSRYRLVEKVGEGGMGVVWKAVDTSLEREVALKILPAEFVAHPARLARFEREAKILGSLNHPGIATLHGFEREGDTPFLVMEYVPGETLAERAAAGPVPLDEAVPLLLQIAQGLEAAHELGVIHRDLKPANVKITPAGQARILDFGLAKALAADPETGASMPAADASQSPTLVASATQQGVVLGTAATMSPEQARGKPVDRRADIWAFGCIAWEMLTGRSLFTGETISDILAAVLRAEVDWEGLPGDAPEWLRRLLRRCLERDPARRLRDIGEARVLLEDVLQGRIGEPPPAEPEVRPARARAGLPWFAAGVVLTALAALAGGTLLVPPATEPPLRKSEIPVSDPIPMPAISPDGRMIAYSNGGRLWIRDLDRLEPREVPGTEEGGRPFWSPDSAWLGYATTSGLWKVPAGGGDRVRIGTTPGAIDVMAGGIVWSEGGRVVYTTGNSGLLEVPAQGGDPVPLLEPGPDEYDFHCLSALPEGRGFLFVVHPREGLYYMGTLSGGTRVDLQEIRSNDIADPVYSPTGHILYKTRTGTSGVWAVPFSLDRMEITGEPFLVASPAGSPSISRDGTFIYSRYDTVPVRLVLVDRSGGVMEVAGREEGATYPSLSPDGRRVAVSAGGPSIQDRHVWIHQVGAETKTRLTFEPGWYGSPDWSPDGRWIVHTEFPHSASSLPRVVLRLADGPGDARDLGAGPGSTPAFTPDGESIVYAGWTEEGTPDLWRVGVEEGSRPEPILEAPGMQIWPRVSPDGRLLAYQSNESGTFEIYLTAYPEGGSRWQVSQNGGIAPRWNGMGDRLYYLQGYDLMEVPISVTPELDIGAPRRLFSIPPTGQPVYPGSSEGYDVSADGERFLVIQSEEGRAGATRIIVIQNWFAEFQDRP